MDHILLADVPLCSGFGQFHSTENKRAPQDYQPITLNEVYALLGNPQRVEKPQARWFIPSNLMSRVHADQREQGTFYALWADLDSAGVQGQTFKEVFSRTCIAIEREHWLYTSRSATIDLPKSRIIVPLAEPVTGEQFIVMQRILNERLRAQGLEPDTVNERPGQLCYLPNKGEFYDWAAEPFGGQLRIDDWAEDIASQTEAERQRQEELAAQARQATTKTRPANLNGEQSGIIDLVLQTYDMESVLQGCGYRKIGKVYLSPTSESGQPGVHVFTRDGKQVCYSYHGLADPLSRGNHNGHSLDVFDALCALRFQGDAKQAVATLVNELDPEGQKQRQREFMASRAGVAGARDDFESEPDEPKPDHKEVYNKFLARIDEVAMGDPADTIDALEIAPDVHKSDLPQARKHALFKKIAKTAETTVSSLMNDLDDSDIKDVKADRDERHLMAARETIKRLGDENLICTESGLWQWQSQGVWARAQDRSIKQVIHEVSESQELTANVVSSIFDLLKTEVFVAGHRFDEVANLNRINVRNGTLVRTGDTWRLEPHCREDYLTTQIPIEYDPGATCPRFETFLKEVFAPASDCPERVRVIKQGLGYTLLASCHLERFFILIGSGANGKSVLLSTLASLIGRRQVTAVQPSQFDNRFQRAHLEGKLANIITEIAEGAQIADAQLKALVSGELTTAEHKHKDPFDFRPVATHWFGTNHLPHTRDFSDALFRRAILVEFPRQFKEHERDVGLTAKLADELPGILNFALEGLNELLRDGQFAVPASSKELAGAWRLEADQVAQFVEECCEPEPGSGVASSELYEEFRSWARNSGITHMVKRKSFSQRMERLGYRLSRTGVQRRIEGVKIVVRQAPDWH